MKSVRSKGKEKLSVYYKPMLATLSDQPFNDSDWLFEIKWDGYRAIADLKKDRVELYSRNGLSFKQLYPAIAAALAKLKIEAVLDGEIVVFNADNKPDFQKLQQFGELKNGKLVYYVFDCLFVKGQSVMNKSLAERKAILQKLLPKNDTIRYADHIVENGIEFFTSVKEMNLEGMIAKRSSSTYQIGKRTSDWLKIKNHNIQEAIIAGYTAPRKSRKYFGSLILAIQEKSKLKYIGHTGTGFSNKTLKNIYDQLQPLVRADSPFQSKVPVNANVTWVDPKLVCNIKFSEVTQSGILRHPVFMGLRIDKTARETDHIEIPRATSNFLAKPEKQISGTRKTETKKVTTKA